MRRVTLQARMHPMCNQLAQPVNVFHQHAALVNFKMVPCVRPPPSSHAARTNPQKGSVLQLHMEPVIKYECQITPKKEGKRGWHHFFFSLFASSSEVQGMNMSSTKMDSASSTAAIPRCPRWPSQCRCPSQILKPSRHQMSERSGEAARMTTTINPTR